MWPFARKAEPEYRSEWDEWDEWTPDERLLRAREAHAVGMLKPDVTAADWDVHCLLSVILDLEARVRELERKS